MESTFQTAVGLSLRAYVTILKGCMGNGFLQLSDRISQCFSPQEKEYRKNF